MNRVVKQIASKTTGNIYRKVTDPIYQNITNAIADNIRSKIMRTISIGTRYTDFELTIEYIRKFIPNLYNDIIDTGVVSIKYSDSGKPKNIGAGRYNISNIVDANIFTYIKNTLVIFNISTRVNHDNDPYTDASITFIGKYANEYVSHLFKFMSINFHKCSGIKRSADDFDSLYMYNIFIHATESRVLNTPKRAIRRNVKEINDIILDKTVKNNIKSNIQGFIKNIDFFNKMGISKCYGILIHGEPGTGKTSLSYALAKYLCAKLERNVCVHNISINDYEGKNTSTFIDRLNEINDKSDYKILIFNDIDNVLGDRIKTPDKCKYLDLFLKLLDGELLDNCFIIFTTNYIDNLDPALLRSGRININCKMSNINKELAEELCRSYKLDPKDVLDDTISYPVNPALLTQKCIDKYNL